nr:hypothetical protein [Tanacetum cinerariifolium]
MEKISDVMGCEDAFKTRLAVYKFEGNALAWWKAYKKAKGGDAWLITVTWADFKKLFFLQSFPRAEQERLKREYHSIRQTNTETSTEFMQHVAHVVNAARNYEILHERDDDTERPDKRQKSGDRHQPTSQQSSHKSHSHNNDYYGSDKRGRGVVIGISRPLSRVVTGATVIITTVMDLTGVVAMTTTTATTTPTTTTTMAVTTGIPVMDVTKETGVISLTDLPILVLRNPGVPLRVTPIQFALLVDVDTRESVVELQADKKPGASGHVFAITEGQAANTSVETSSASGNSITDSGNALCILFPTILP